MTSKTDGIKLTFKQKEWLKLYLETGNATQSALQVYDTDDPNTASVIGSENLTKLRIPVLALMEKRGLTLGRLLEVLDDGLQANKVLSAKVIVQGDHKEATTQTDDFIEVPDHLTRHKYLETAAKWLGVEKKESASVEMTDGNRKLVFKVTRGE
jgi:hypothetical protein